jgi:hypothetical protein
MVKCGVFFAVRTERYLEELRLQRTYCPTVMRSRDLSEGISRKLLKGQSGLRAQVSPCGIYYGQKRRKYSSFSYGFSIQKTLSTLMYTVCATTKMYQHHRLTSTTLKMTVLRVVATCSIVEVYDVSDVPAASIIMAIGTHCSDDEDSKYL